MKKTIMLLILVATNVEAQTIIPGRFTTSEVCYKKEQYSSTGKFTGFKVVCEKFKAPEIDFGLGAAKIIDASPLDPSRSVFELPTYPLAEFHWWIFNTTREIAQQQYAGCVERVSAYQDLLGISPQINQSSHPAFFNVVAIRDYRVPFNPITPKTLEYARANADAAIFSTNLAVHHIAACEATAVSYKTQLKKKLQAIR
jgi:hypothetical protein